MRSSASERRCHLPGGPYSRAAGRLHVRLQPRAAHRRHRPLAAGLGVHTFMKPVEVIEYDEEGLKALAARINAFAVSEDLPAHGECVLSRFVKDPYDKATLREQEKEAGLR